MQIKYVIYSHTDYLDILSVQTEYLNSYENKVLLINSSNLDISEITKQYKDVIYYNESLPYASRLLSLSKLTDKYILLIHDIDILIHQDVNIINSFVPFMDDNNVDRIDLQVRHSWDRNSLKVNYNNIILSKQVDSNNYIYNVNPSIWKLTSLLSVMNLFNKETYRTIETMPIQVHCSKNLHVYKLYSEIYNNCGWFSCLDFFQFIHITHHGKLLPKIKNNLDTHLLESYLSITDKILKINSTREYSTRLL
jgi:hypothetical protein